MRRFLYSLSATVLLAAAVHGEGVRVAVLAPDAPDLGAVLTAELAKRTEVQVVERQEIERVAGEQALAAASGAAWQRWGQLLHADALLIVSQTQLSGVPLRVARLVAVRPGVAIDSAVLDSNPASLPAEAARIAAQFAPLLSKIGALDPGASVKVSLLGLHFELNSPIAAGTERALNTLLADRLIHRPRVLVLERWNLDAAAWEKEIQAEAPAPFWTGSCLVDGRLVERGGNLTAEVRLRQAANQPPVTLSVTEPADRIAELADILAARIAAALGAPEAALSWDRKEESLNETLLAHWALGNRLYRDAFEAAATADALCPRVPDIELLRLECETQLAFPRPPITDRTMWVPYNADRDGIPELPGQLDAAQTALDHLLALWALGTRDPAFQPAMGRIRMQALYTVQQTSRLLAAVQERGFWQGDEAGWSQLRGKIRDVTELLLKQDTSFQVRVCAYLFPYAPYWFEKPDDTIVFYRRLSRLPGNPAFPNPFNWLHVHWMGNRPWLIAWHGESAAEVAAAWSGFLDAMRASPSLQDQVAGWVWKVDSSPFRQRAALLPGLADFAWKNRAEAARADSEIDLSPLGETLSDLAPRLGGMQDDPSIRQVVVGFLPSLFEAGTWIRPRTLHAFGLATVRIAPKEIAGIAPLFAAYRAAMAGSPALTTAAGKELDRVGRNIFGTSGETDAGEIRFAARFRDMAGADGQAGSIRNLVEAEGRVWFIEARSRQIIGWDPVSDAREAIPYDEALAGATATELAVGSRHIVVLAGDRMWRYDRSARTWAALDLPPARYLPAAMGGQEALLYWPSTGEKEGGGILSLDPAAPTFATVLSSRSNPPRNELDGRADSRGLSLHLAGDGRMDYVVKLALANQSQEFRTWGDCHDDFYTQKEPGGAWQRVLTVTSTFTRVCHLFCYPTPQGDLLVTRSRVGSTNLSSFGQLIAWDRASGKLTLLLSNPATDRPSLPGVAQWEMPPDLASSETTPLVAMFPVLQDGVLWVLRWENLEKQGMQRPAVYRFRPGVPRGERVALDFDPEAGIPPNGNGREERFLRAGNFVAHSSGFVLERSPETGLWYLPFAEMSAALDAPAPH